MIICASMFDIHTPNTISKRYTISEEYLEELIVFDSA